MLFIIYSYCQCINIMVSGETALPVIRPVKDNGLQTKSDDDVNTFFYLERKKVEFMDIHKTNVCN